MSSEDPQRPGGEPAPSGADSERQPASDSAQSEGPPGSAPPSAPGAANSTASNETSSPSSLRPPQGPPEGRPNTGRYNPEVAAALVTAFYSSQVGLPDAARSRVQITFGIASAIGLALIGAGVLAKLPDEVWWVRLLGGAAVFAWAVTAALYVYALTVPVTPERRTVKGAEAFVDAVVGKIANERDAIDARAQWANAVAIAAGVLTLSTFVAILIGPTNEVRGRIIVTNSETVAIRSVCPKATASVDGQLEKASLAQELVVVRPSETSCGVRDAVLYLPRTTILAIRTFE